MEENGIFWSWTVQGELVDEYIGGGKFLSTWNFGRQFVWTVKEPREFPIALLFFFSIKTDTELTHWYQVDTMVLFVPCGLRCHLGGCSFCSIFFTGVDMVLTWHVQILLRYSRVKLVSIVSIWGPLDVSLFCGQKNITFM